MCIVWNSEWNFELNRLNITMVNLLRMQNENEIIFNYKLHQTTQTHRSFNSIATNNRVGDFIIWYVERCPLITRVATKKLSISSLSVFHYYQFNQLCLNKITWAMVQFTKLKQNWKNDSKCAFDCFIIIYYVGKKLHLVLTTCVDCKITCMYKVDTFQRTKKQYA